MLGGLVNAVRTSTPKPTFFMILLPETATWADSTEEEETSPGPFDRNLSLKNPWTSQAIEPARVTMDTPRVLRRESPTHRDSAAQVEKRLRRLCRPDDESEDRRLELE
jgi:hypothetical protein